jgi:hypothetical protein
MLDQVGEADALLRLDVDEDLSLVFVRNEALRNDHEEDHGRRENDDREDERRGAMAERHAQAALVKMEHPIEEALRHLIQLSVELAGVRAKEHAAEERRERE